MKRLASGFLIACFACAAWAFPDRPVSIIVPQAPGGANDTLTRLVAGKLSSYWGQPVVVDFKPGGGVIVATQYVAKSPPDGHVIGLMTSSHAVNPSLAQPLPYDSVKDFAPLARLGYNVVGLVVVPSLAVNDVRALIDLARTKPDFLSHGSNGVGSAGHVTAELFKHMTGVKMVHVPYKGGAQLYADMMGGRVPVAFAVLASAMPLVKSGKLRVLGVTNLQRSKLFPEYPPISETVPGYEMTVWNGLMAPGATPREIVQRISTDVMRLASDVELRPKFAEMGYEAAPLPAAEFAAFIRSEMEAMVKLMRESGAKFE